MQLVIWSCIAVLTTFVFLFAFLGKIVLAIVFAVLTLIIGVISAKLRLNNQSKGKLDI